MPTKLPHRAVLSLTLALVLALVAVAAARTWTPVPRSHLQVTSGQISTLGSGLLQTGSSEMRAVERDGGHHAQSAQIRFRFRRPSVETSTLGSGAVRRQIGLKLRAADPCNLVYAMWREYPQHAVVVSVKRNPGQHTSSACGNRGYSDVATLALPIAASVPDHRTHVLRAYTRREANGSLTLRVYADGAVVYAGRLSAALSGGLDGPIGVRSDNGDYVFALSAADRG
jgi:hypothetical protein